MYMLIEVSHESPMVLSEMSLSYNDYDYALVHLFEDNPEYFKFFKDSVDAGRKVYLDNSIFELGESFDSKEYIKWINKLNPTYYIVPDVLEDAQGTIKKYFEFQQLLQGSCGADPLGADEPEIPKGGLDYKNTSLTIGVVQGRDWYDLIECYKAMSELVDMIAISFDYEYYLYTGVGKESCLGQENSIDWYSIMQNKIQTEGIPRL